MEEAKEKQGRVPFETLIKEKIIKIGEPLHTKKIYSETAVVLSDGNLQYHNEKGSIHRIGAVIQQTPSCNGWKFWYIVRNDKAILIDELRDEYLKVKRGV
jgi:modification methylase